MIDFTLSESQNAIRLKARNFSNTVLATAAETYDRYPTQVERFRALRPFYRQAVEAGLIRGLIAKGAGGDAGTLVEAAILVEELSKHDRSVSLTIFSVGLGLSSLLIAGTPEQKEELLKPFLTGEGEPLASLLHTEPQGIANWLERGGKGLQTIAKKEGDDWVLNGEKVASLTGLDERLTAIDLGYEL